MNDGAPKNEVRCRKKETKNDINILVDCHRFTICCEWLNQQYYYLTVLHPLHMTY